MWLVNYFREWKVWRIVKKVYDSNRSEFEKVGLKRDWFGRIYKVINRDPDIPLGTIKDEELLVGELKEISDVLVKTNTMDILAYELKPLEKNHGDTFENAYLVTLTPAYRMDTQYVTFSSTVMLILIGICILCGLGYLLMWLL